MISVGRMRETIFGSPRVLSVGVFAGVSLSLFGSLSPLIAEAAGPRNKLPYMSASELNRIKSFSTAKGVVCGRDEVRISNPRIIAEGTYDRFKADVMLCRKKMVVTLANVAFRNPQTRGVLYEFISANPRFGVSLYRGQNGDSASLFYVNKNIGLAEGREVAYAGQVISSSGTTINTGRVTGARVTDFGSQVNNLRSDEVLLQRQILDFGLGAVTGPLGRRALAYDKN